MMALSWRDQGWSQREDSNLRPLDPEAKVGLFIQRQLDETVWLAVTELRLYYHNRP